MGIGHCLSASLTTLSHKGSERFEKMSEQTSSARRFLNHSTQCVSVRKCVRRSLQARSVLDDSQSNGLYDESMIHMTLLL